MTEVNLCSHRRTAQVGFEQENAFARRLGQSTSQIDGRGSLAIAYYGA
jgi:hypothetical protein